MAASRRGGRPPTHFLQYASSSRPTADIALYPSEDGSRIIRDASQSKKKRKKVTPEALDDTFAGWTPGIDTAPPETPPEEEQEDDSEEVAPLGSGVVVNVVAAQQHQRARYFTSSFFTNFCAVMASATIANTPPARVAKKPFLYQIRRLPRLLLFFLHAAVIALVIVSSVVGAASNVTRAFPSTGLRRMQLLRAGWYPATMTNPQTCATLAVLEEYHLLLLKGALNVHDFIAADREKAMGRMFRQFAFLKRLKRHDPAGVKATTLGGCAVLCWACPHEHINLPTNWQEVDKKFKFLYMLILAMDANFRLTNRIIKGERDDPELGPGWAYTVPPGPYKEHLKGYVSEKDITTCIAFAALLQKDSKVTTGLRTSGVGACMCARHEVFRPNGVGDLQKGERYANMDYIFFSSIVGLTLLITISYDIVCQWKINLQSRIAKLPAALQPVDRPDFTPFHERVSMGIPVWHAAAHEDRCRVSHSLRHIPGVGHTDGEGVERGWSHMNQHASSTKEMGQGNRHDTLDDVIGHHNWQRNIAQGDTLSRRLIIAKEERDVQIKCFDNVRRAVQPEVAKQWIEQVTLWEENRNINHAWPNPYELPSEGVTTEAQVRLDLQKQERDEAATGQASGRVATATAFLSLGLHIEHLQRQISVEASSEATLTANQASVLEDRRLQVWRKLRDFREAQRIFMPNAHALAVAAEDDREARDLPRPLAEAAKLWLPSDLSADARRTGCDSRLPGMELKLRVAQCEESLNTIRSYLHAKQHLIHRRNKNFTGQRKTTRARTLIDRLTERIKMQYVKYTRAREALLELGGLEQYAQKFQVLLSEHLTLDGEETPPDHEASRRMNRAGGGGPRSKKKVTESESTKTLSWIWVAGSTPGSGGMHDSIRREYLKARARKHRWTEEVMLLVEEMRRVLRFLRWRAEWWRTHPVSWDELDDEVSDGLKAYAERQALLCETIAANFQKKWAETEVSAVRQAVAAANELQGLEGLEGTMMES
ncbi:hypothetical protein HWV62_39676 [Athelia sp. TMB]|nr:hypothetical protein HWV62_39676 [Athelia sp. TMB]